MKLIEQIQDIFYDILGYIIPGAIALIILITIYFSRHSFAYYIFEHGLIDVLFQINSLISTYFSWFLFFLVLFISFLLGHVIRIIPNLGNALWRKICSKTKRRKQKERKHTGLSILFFWRSAKQYIYNLVDNNYKYLDSLENNLLKQLQAKGSKTIQSCLHNSPAPEKLMHTYATTNTRFQNVTNLYTKYHNKSNLFEGLRILCKIILIDATVTMLFFGLLDFIYMIVSLLLVYPQSQSGFLCYCFIGATEMTVLVVKPFIKKFIITLCIYLFYLTFYYQNLRHSKLARKEQCLYIAHMLEQREK